MSLMVENSGKHLHTLVVKKTRPLQFDLRFRAINPLFFCLVANYHTVGLQWLLKDNEDDSAQSMVFLRNFVCRQKPRTIMGQANYL